jgi:hypothetical protein
MQVIQTYQQQYSRVPAWETLAQILTDECQVTGTEQKVANDFIFKLKALPTEDIDFVVDRVVLFCRERATLNAVKHVAKYLREGKLPPEGCTKLFEEAFRVGENLDDIGYILHHSVDTVIDKACNPGFGLRTGIPQFDSIWRTGWAPGWLITLLAPPKRFKTTAAINVALSVAGFGVGEDVLYYPCEISQEQAALKAFYNISGLGEDYMFESVNSFREAVKAAIHEKIAGNLIIKHFPIGTASITDIKAHAKMVIKQLNIKPRMIVIDYADTVRVADPSQPRDVQQANIYKDAIAFGKSVDACVLMPDRCNAETVGLKVPNLTSFQGAYAKGGIVDIAMGLCSTEVEYTENILRTFVFINRHGPRCQHFRGKVDPELSRINWGEAIPYDPDDNEPERKPRRSSNRGGGGGNMPDELTDP